MNKNYDLMDEFLKSLKKNRTVFKNYNSNQSEFFYLTETLYFELIELADKRETVSIINNCNILKLYSHDEVYYLIIFPNKRAFLKAILSNSLSVCELIAKNQLIVIPLENNSVAVYYYISEKYKKDVYSKLNLILVKDYSRIKLYKNKTGDLFIVDYSTEAEIYQSYDDAIKFNEELSTLQ